MCNEKLKKEIWEKYKSESSFASAVGWSCQKLSRIISGVTEPRIDDAAIISKALCVTLDDVALFFTQ